MNWRPIALVFVVAFSARAAFLGAMGSGAAYTLTGDSETYIARARNLARHQVFSASEAAPFIPDTVRTPGYPAFLTFFCGPESCPRERAVVWAQAVLGAATAAALCLASWLLFGDRRAALIAGAALALDLATVAHTGLILTETLFTFCFSLGLLALAWARKGGLHVRRAAAAGLLFGLSALVRPAGLYFFAFAAAALAVSAWWERPRARREAAAAVAALILGGVLLPAAWMARNKALVGRWTFSSIQGLNVSYMRAAAVEMELSGLGYVAALERLKAAMERDHGRAFSGLDEEAAFAGRWAFRFITRHALTYAKVMAKDAVKMMGGHGVEILSWTVLHDPADDPRAPGPSGATAALAGTRGLLARHPGLGLAIAAYSAFLLAAYLLAVRGFLKALAAGQAAEALIAAAPVVYFVAISVGALAYYRMRLPLMPSVFLLAGLGLPRGKSRAPSGARRSP